MIEDTTMPDLRTAEQARQWLASQRMSATAFASKHGLPLDTVYKVLNGHQYGLRGAAHKAAVALGMKADDAAMQHPPFG